MICACTARKGENMKNTLSRRFVVLLSILLAVVLAATLGMTLTSGISFAESESAPIPESSLVIGHVSDIHYFPLQHCYRKVDAADYEDSDFFYSLTGDTKLVLESGMTLNKTIQSIIRDAQEGVAPHYFVASGDLSKNGERLSLIDVANALRYLQNEVRKVTTHDYSDFQVFATTGNHDLYNPDGAIYSTENGKHIDTDVVSAMQFALIFAGLGFPDANLTGENGAINLTEYMPEEYWSSSYTSGYQASRNAESVDINYYSPVLQSTKTLTNPSERLEALYGLGDDINVLSYSAEVLTPQNKAYSFLVIDASDRTEESVGTVVALGKNEYEAYPSSSTDIIFLEDSDGNIDTSTRLTKKSDKSTIDAAFAANKNVYRATYRKHLTGGRITEECLDWMEDFCETQTGDKTTLDEETFIAVCHQNALPHFEQEDDILKDFTLYNWEYTSKRLLGMGVRYVLTGHMHASDIMDYTDAEGRTLYDFETGSLVSYASPHRYITIERKNCDGKLGEKTISVLNTLDNLKEVASDHIASNPEWDQAAYDSAVTLEQKLASNPDFEIYVRRYDMLSVQSLDDYSTIDIYSRLLDRAVNHFLSERMMGSLKKTVKNMLVGEDAKLPSILSSYGPMVFNIADYAIDTILYELYPDGYPYNGQTYDNAVDYLKAIVFKFASTEFGDASITCTANPTNAGKMTIHDLVTCISTAHAAGVEIKLCKTDAELQAEYAYIDAHFDDTDCTGMTATDKLKAFKQPVDKTYRKRMTAAIKDLHEWCTSGRLVEYLLDTLLKPLYYDDNSLLKTLITHKFDFSQAVNKPKHDNPDEVYLTASEYSDLEFVLELVNPLLIDFIKGSTGISYPEDHVFVSADNIVIDTLVTEMMPVVKSLAASLIGFNLTGDTITQAVDTALDGYLTHSFYVGLGGILDNIIVAYATDVCPDLADMSDLDTPFIVRAQDGFSYGGQDITYANNKLTPSKVGAAFNPATQANGRVPSHVTSAFDVANPTTGYTIKFYTAEDVFASFGFREAGSNSIYNTVGTWNVLADFSKPYIDRTTTKAFDGITVEMTTQTIPQYIPLIDLGLAAFTHGEVEDDNDVPYVYGDRDKASGNSVIYWNVTTVKLNGLDPNKEYEYDLEGVYTTSADEQLHFSLTSFASGSKGFRIKTAKPDTETSFEFLAIADIQGMIQGMYTDSFKAVEALLKDARTKNFDFVINAGDMVDNGKNFTQWGYALNTYQPLFANYSQIFTAGNHEGNTYGMTNFFDYAIPTDNDGNPLITDVLGGVYYSFDYANAHFVVLNTNDADVNGLGTTQLDWLKKDLEGSNKKWKFVLMHKSIFSGGSHSYDGEVVKMREQLVPLFAETGVNIVFGGHDHTYTSTMLIDKDGNATSKQDLSGTQYAGDGVLYITLGTMGTKYYEYGENPSVTPKFDGDKSILHTLDSQTFGKVKVTGDKIEFVSYYYDRATDSLKVVGETTLSSNPIFDKRIAITLIVVIPTLAIGAGVGITLGVLKKKGKLGKKTA